jgi:hypothetical protein
MFKETNSKIHQSEFYSLFYACVNLTEGKGCWEIIFVEGLNEMLYQYSSLHTS